MKGLSTRGVWLAWVWLAGLVGTRPVHANLSETLDRLLGSHRNVDFSVEVVRARDGRRLYGHQTERPLIPASNMKIVTTAAAVKRLGPDYRFSTRVGLQGTTLVVVGAGDPLLGDDNGHGTGEPSWRRVLLDLAGRLKELGVETVTDIVVDTTCFDDQRVHPNWPAKDLNKGFSSEVCGLNFHGNCIDVTVRNETGRAVVQLDPPTRFVELDNDVRVVSSGRTGVGAYRIPGQPNRWRIAGRVRREQGPFATPVEKPAAFFGFVCAEVLAQQGIRVTGQLREQRFVPAADFREVTVYHHELETVLQRCNRDSFNLAAECLIKTLGRQATRSRQGGSWALGRTVVSQYLTSLGLSSEQFVIDDGSGLSPENRLSARCLVEVLLDMARSDTWDLFERSLAIGGVNGTLDSRFLEEPYRGHIRAKSGYLGDYQVRSLSGFCETKQGKVFFSILANGGGITVRQTITRMAKAILDGANG